MERLIFQYPILLWLTRTQNYGYICKMGTFYCQIRLFRHHMSLDIMNFLIQLIVILDNLEFLVKSLMYCLFLTSQITKFHWRLDKRLFIWPNLCNIFRFSYWYTSCLNMQWRFYYQNLVSSQHTTSIGQQALFPFFLLALVWQFFLSTLLLEVI